MKTKNLLFATAACGLIGVSGTAHASNAQFNADKRLYLGDITLKKSHKFSQASPPRLSMGATP